MGIRRYHIEKEAIEKDDIPDKELPIEKLDELAIQSGITDVTFPFTTTGVEEVTVTIPFPKSYPTGIIPRVVFSHSHSDITIRIDTVTETNFTLRAKDNLGVDFTAGVVVTISWIAIYPR